MSEYTVFRIEAQDPIAEIVLDRPQKLNAMAPVFFQELRAVFEQVDRDDSIRAVVA